MFKAMLRSSGAFPYFCLIFDNLVSLKLLVTDQKGPNIGPRGQVVSVNRVRLNVK